MRLACPPEYLSGQVNPSGLHEVRTCSAVTLGVACRDPWRSISAPWPASSRPACWAQAPLPNWAVALVYSSHVWSSPSVSSCQSLQQTRRKPAQDQIDVTVQMSTKTARAPTPTTHLATYAPTEYFGRHLTRANITKPCASSRCPHCLAVSSCDMEPQYSCAAGPGRT